MPKILTCDKCGAEDATEDYAGQILCDYHRAEVDLRGLRRAYAEKTDWVERCWLSELAEMRKEILRLEDFLHISHVS